MGVHGRALDKKVAKKSKGADSDKEGRERVPKKGELGNQSFIFTKEGTKRHEMEQGAYILREEVCYMMLA